MPCPWPTLGTPCRRRIGYLNTLEDLLKHLGHQLQQYLPALLALTLCLLEGVVPHLPSAPGAGRSSAAAMLGPGCAPDGAGGAEGAPDPGAAGGEAADPAAGEAAEGTREVRSRCLRLLAGVLERFPVSAGCGFLWPRLLAAAEPLLPRLAAEAAADRAPPLLALAAALASSQHLVGVLADGCSSSSNSGSAGGNEQEDAGGVGCGGEEGAQAAAAAELVPCAEPWAREHRLGSRLLGQCVAVLSAPTCAEPARMTMLGTLESIFDLPDPLPQQVLGPHMSALLAGLQAIVVAVWQQQRGGGGGGGGLRGRAAALRRGGAGASAAARAAPKRATATRALAVLEVVGSRVGSWEAAGQLTQALLPLLQPQEGGRAGRRKGGSGEDEMVSRTLAVLAAVWGRLAAADTDEQQQQPAKHNRTAAGAAAGGGPGEGAEERQQLLRHVLSVLAPLAGSLEGDGARKELSSALQALGQLLPEARRPAELLTRLNAMSATAVSACTCQSVGWVQRGNTV